MTPYIIVLLAFMWAPDGTEIPIKHTWPVDKAGWSEAVAECTAVLTSAREAAEDVDAAFVGTCTTLWQDGEGEPV